MALVDSNIDELEKHLSKVFKGMLKSAELKLAGIEAGKAIGRHVGDTLMGGGDSGYNYEQSGQLQELVSTEGKHPELKQTQNNMTIGVFELNNMNEGVYARRNHQYQLHKIWNSEKHEMVTTMISLKAETQMPKWILAEFGSGSYASGEVPSDFKVNYSKRDKPYMYGPSIGPVRGIGGGEKSGLFMVTGDTLKKFLGEKQESSNDFRMHMGIKAGHVFSEGLNSSKQEVYEILGEGIQEYLDNN